MLDGFVFHPFAYPDPDRLVAVGVAFPEALVRHDLRRSAVAGRVPRHPDEPQLRARGLVRSRQPQHLWRRRPGACLHGASARRHVSRDRHGAGARPRLHAEELGPNGPPAAIISHRLWQSRFGGDPAILNRAIRVSGRAASIVGVMPPGLVLIGTDLWIPWGGDPVTVPRNVRQFNVLARLAPGASLAQANAELAAIARRVEQAEKPKFAEYENWQLTATPWAAALLQDVRPAAFVLLGAVGLVLFIACANLTNLFLARSSTRHRELAVRLALGAARWRLTRLLLTESLLLALAGAAVGLLVAWVGLRSAGALIPGQFQMLGLEAGVNLTGARVEPGARPRRGRAGRRAAGLAGDAHRSARVAQGGRAQRSIARRPSPASRADRWRARAVGRSAARRRPAAAELPEHSARRSWLRLARGADDETDAAAGPLSWRCRRRVLRAAGGAPGEPAGRARGVSRLAIPAFRNLCHTVPPGAARARRQDIADSARSRPRRQATSTRCACRSAPAGR